MSDTALSSAQQFTIRWSEMRRSILAGLSLTQPTAISRVVRVMSELLDEAMRVVESVTSNSDRASLIADYEFRLHLLQTELDTSEALKQQAMRELRAITGELDQVRKDRRWPAHKTLKDLSELIGDEAAYTLVVRWGGRVLSIPGTFDSTHVICGEIGTDATAKLVEQYGGQKLYLPVERNVMIDARNADIVGRARAGISHSKIAVDCGLTRGRVSQILSKLAPELRG